MKIDESEIKSMDKNHWLIFGIFAILAVAPFGLEAYHTYGRILVVVRQDWEVVSCRQNVNIVDGSRESYTINNNWTYELMPENPSLDAFMTLKVKSHGNLGFSPHETVHFVRTGWQNPDRNQTVYIESNSLSDKDNNLPAIKLAPGPLPTKPVPK